MTAWPVRAEALTIRLKMDSEAVGTVDPSSATHRRKTLSRTRHSPSASSKMGTVMPATRGCQTAVARHFVKGAGPSDGGLEGQALRSQAKRRVCLEGAGGKTGRQSCFRLLCLVNNSILISGLWCPHCRPQVERLGSGAALSRKWWGPPRRPPGPGRGGGGKEESSRVFLSLTAPLLLLISLSLSPSPRSRCLVPLYSPPSAETQGLVPPPPQAPRRRRPVPAARRCLLKPLSSPGPLLKHPHLQEAGTPKSVEPLSGP